MNDLVLALDTTRETGSLALNHGERTLREVELRPGEGFGEVLFEGIQKLLDDEHVKLADCAVFAAASGPGSFTGVRIGLACIKGLAEALGRPAFGISNLEALAEFGQSQTRVAVIDARRGEVYAAVYGSGPRDEMVTTLPELLASLLPSMAEFIVTDAVALRSLLAGTLFENVPITQAPTKQACAIARLAWRRFRAGTAGDAVSIEPNYVRRSDAEMLWRSPVTEPGAII